MTQAEPISRTIFIVEKPSLETEEDSKFFVSVASSSPVSEEIFIVAEIPVAKPYAFQP